MVYSSGRPFILMDVRVVCLPPEVDEPQAPTPAGAAALPAPTSGAPALDTSTANPGGGDASGSLILGGPDQALGQALGQWQYRDVVPGSGEVGEVWCRGPTVFSGARSGPNPGKQGALCAP